MSAQYDDNGLADMLDKLPPAERERFAKLLRAPDVFFAGSMMDVLAILDIPGAEKLDI